MPTLYDLKLTEGQIDLITNLVRLAAANVGGDAESYPLLEALWNDIWDQRKVLGLADSDD